MEKIQAFSKFTPTANSQFLFFRKGVCCGYVKGPDCPEIQRIWTTQMPKFADDGSVEDSTAEPDETVAKYNSIMGIKSAGDDDDDDFMASPGRSEG